jgi:hypothetical protein
MRTGIPPISDYSHWNEDAAAVWYEENKYDMAHPEVFEDYDDPYAYLPEDELPEDECEERYQHQMNTSGRNILFAGSEIYAPEICDDCGFSLSCDISDYWE